MRRAAVALTVLVVAACGGPDAPAASTDESAGTPEGYTGTAMADHLHRQLDILGTKMVELAEAMPEEAYDWAPMDGVRSVGAVFAHVAADNYYVPALLDRPVEGTGVTKDSGIRDYENARGSKADIVAELARSFEEMDEALTATRESLDRSVMLRENAITTGDLWVRAIVHLHEHLGQSIAYARANAVVPPWSGGG